MAGKRVLIIYAHQDPKSMNGSLKDAAVTELSSQGCQVTVSDLYAMNFEPRATRKDIVGALSNSKSFNYAAETYEAYKKGALSSDVVEEQKKVQEADLVIFQFPLYWYSMPAIMKGWIDRVLCQGFAFEPPKYFEQGLFKHGVFHFCGFKILAPQISFAPERASEDKRKEMVTSWARRLATIWDEKPIHCTPSWYFE
ncbi:ribosyldihydronicotinamide dehydrogenase [quinone] isoform X2 [Antechinus flavipes]|uniref:ribosyldihydronicotinamide dehydrogenase [quinone] isoform X2 n=1 Tax=Antechinus flavipes TaxID=38775 RepID=UPI002235815E|nr:ribosyldihydronicotinamide dehydrogenase [quinone] isoform X2 [Antechinus flavipes]